MFGFGRKLVKKRINKSIFDPHIREKDDYESAESDFSKIANTWMEQIKHPEGDLQIRFKELIESYSQDEKPIGVEDAKRIILTMLSLAAVKRSELAVKIDNSIQGGSLFEYYYGRMAEINKLTIKTHTKLMKMQFLREQYELKEYIYEEVIKRSYDDDILEDYDFSRIDDIQDIFKKMDNYSSGFDDDEKESYEEVIYSEDDDEKDLDEVEDTQLTDENENGLKHEEESET